MKAIKYLAVLALSAFIFNSCTKDVAGPTGPQGAQGLQGPSSSYFVTIDSAASVPAVWPVDNSAPTTTYNFTIPNVKGLTNPSTSIVDVYYSNSIRSLSAYYTPLPVANIFASGDGFSYYFTGYTVTVQYFNPNTAIPPAKVYFKVVVITNP
jgi:hypothetical protein